MRGSSNGMSVRVDRFPAPFASGASESGVSPAKTDHQSGASFETIIGRIRASSKDSAEPADDQRAAKGKHRAGSLAGASPYSDQENVSPEERLAPGAEAEPVDCSVRVKGSGCADSVSDPAQENEKESWQDQAALAGFFTPALLQYALPGNPNPQPSAALDSANDGAAVGASTTGGPGNSPVTAENPQLVLPCGPLQNASAASQNLNPAAAGAFALTDSAEVPVSAASSRQTSAGELSEKPLASPSAPLDWIAGSTEWIRRMRQPLNRLTWPADSPSGATQSSADPSVTPSPLNDTEAEGQRRNAPTDGLAVDPIFKEVEAAQAGRREVAQAGAYKILLEDSKARAESATSPDSRSGRAAQVSEEAESAQAVPIPSVSSVPPDRAPANSSARDDAAAALRQPSWRSARENPDTKSSTDEQGDGTSVVMSGGRKDSTMAEALPAPKALSRDSQDPQAQAALSFRTAADPKDVLVSKAQQSGAPRPPDMIFQLAEKIQAQLQNGGTELTIQLKPESLGRMEIRAEAGVHGLVARIVTETASVKHYLESNLSMLQQNLHDQGLKIDRIDFIVQDGIDSRLWGGQQNAGQPASGQQGGDSRRQSDTGAAARLAVDDEILVDPAAMAVLGPNNTFHTVA